MRQLISWRKLLLENHQPRSHSRNSLRLTEPDSSFIHNSQPSVAMLSQINPLHVLLSLFKMHFNNILSIPVQVFYMGSSLQISNQKSCMNFLLPIRATCLTHPPYLIDRREMS